MPGSLLDEVIPAEELGTSGSLLEEDSTGAAMEEEMPSVTLDEELASSELVGSMVAEDSGCVSGALGVSSEHATSIPAMANAVAAVLRKADFRTVLWRTETS